MLSYLKVQPPCYLNGIQLFGGKAKSNLSNCALKFPRNKREYAHVVEFAGKNFSGKFCQDLQWRICGGGGGVVGRAPGTQTFLGPISFIFMQFSGNNRLMPSLLELAPPTVENHGSTMPMVINEICPKFGYLLTS